MLTEIQKFALKRVGMSEDAYDESLNHGVDCRCNLCHVFNQYLPIKEAIEAWEAAKKRGEVKSCSAT